MLEPITYSTDLSMEILVKKVNDRFSELQKAQITLKENWRRAFDAFEGINQRLDGVHNQLEDVNKDLNSIELRLDNVETGLVNLDSKLEGAKTLMDQQFDELRKEMREFREEMRDGFKKTNKRLDELEK